VANDDEFLLFALTCRESHIAASIRLRLDPHDILALDIDNAVTLVLRDYDAKQDERRAGMMWGSGETTEAESMEGVEVL